MAQADPFSTSTMHNALHHLRFAAAREPITEEYPAVAPPYPRGISVAIPPPGFTPSPSPLINSSPSPLINSSRVAVPPQELEMRLRWMFGFMTNDEENASAPFKETISKLNGRELQSMASLLTSDSDYFLKIARIKNGSKRLQKLLGKSDDVDTIFAAAILRLFLRFITDKYALHVVKRGITVFDKEKKEAMYGHILYYALDIARDKLGCIALNQIITDMDDRYYRNQIFDIVARNALSLSNDAYGNFVIRHVLTLNDLRCTHNIAGNLRGHYVDLSFQKHGSFIVEKLLETTEDSIIMVVEELLDCEGNKLLRLARNEYGNFVVRKALRVTQKEIFMSDLFCGLVQKLMPYLQLLRRSPGSNIASILESIC